MLSYLLIEFQQHQRKDYSLTITSLITELYHFQAILSSSFLFTAICMALIFYQCYYKESEMKCSKQRK